MKHILWLALLVLAGSGVTALGATWFVSPDGSPDGSGTSWTDALAHPAQAAANARADDEIWVAAGRYWGETINLVPGVRLLGGFTGQETIAADRSTNAALTVLETTNDLPVLSIVGDGSGAVVRLAGFTLRAGVSVGAVGRGLVSSNAAVELEGCVFRNFKGGTFEQPGSAVAASGGALRVKTCAFVVNQTVFGGYGAAIGCRAVVPVELVESEFSRNRSGGASALALNGSQGTVTGCLFSRNTVTDDGVPGVIELYRSQAAITRNRFLFNRGGAGAGVFIFEFRESVGETNLVAFNVFAGNVANEVAGAFPAASVSYRSAARMEFINNTFAGEVSLRLPGNIADTGPLAGTAKSVQVANNLFLAHHNGDQFDALSESRRNVFLDLGEGMRFRRHLAGRPEGWAEEEVVGGLRALDFHLQSTAISRGFGDPSVVPVGTLDLAGRSAVHPDGRVDAGALAFDPDHQQPGPAKVVHLHPNGDDNAAGDSWTNAVKSLAGALRQVAVAAPTELWLAAGSFAGGCGPEGVPPGVTLRGSFSGQETNRLQRGRELTTELNASQTNVLVSFDRNGSWNEIEGLILDGTGANVIGVSRSGLSAVLSWPHVHRCRFENHRGRGVGVAVYSEGGIIEDCEFVANSPSPDGPIGAGGVIHVTGRGLPAIFRRNGIRRNTNSVSASAVGWFGPPTRIEYNVWLDNHSAAGTRGLVVYESGGNLAPLSGHGCWHNTFLANQDLSACPKNAEC